ncbi:MAG: diaminopimelate decarboxylase family protein [Pseudomonadales bacterium]
MSNTPAETLSPLLTQTDRLSISEAGDLMIDGCTALELVAQYGSPLFAISEQTFRDNLRRFRRAFESHWPEPINVMFAIKSNNSFALRAIANEEGAGGDCFGIGELACTLRGGCDPSKIALNGSYKSDEALKVAIDAGIAVHLDSMEEIDDVVRVARELNKKVRVGLRLKVLPEAYFSELQSDHYPQPGRFIDAMARLKWGVKADLAVDIINRTKEIDELEFYGFHTHLGRVSNDPTAFAELYREYARMIGDIYQRTGVAPFMVDLGGGWPRERDPESRTQERNPHGIENYAKQVCQVIQEEFNAIDMPLPQLWLEPGRYITGNSGVLLSSVGLIKREENQTWVNIDASSYLMIMVETLGAKNHVTVASGMHRPYTQRADVVGPICIPSIFELDSQLPDIERGEVMAILDAGHYCESQASQFNSMPRPATVLINDGQAEIIRQRETLDDVLASQRVPARLA